MSNRRDEIDAIEELLPWYAAGRLGPADARRVEEALARVPELRASLRLVQEDRDETIALNEGLGAPGGGGAWARVLAVTEAEPRKPTFGSRVSSLAGLVGLGAQPNRTRLAWVAAAAALMLLEGAAIISLLPPAGEAPFRTAGASASGQGAEVLVAFAPDARLDQVSAWLNAHHASIVEGPRGGLYRVRFGDKPMNPDETAALMREIRAVPIVTMVLPAKGQ